MGDSRGGAYRIVSVFALRVEAGRSAREWRCSVEMAPRLVVTADLGDGHDPAPSVRVVRGREQGRTMVGPETVQGVSRARAMSHAAAMLLRLMDDERAALAGE